MFAIIGIVTRINASVCISPIREPIESIRIEHWVENNDHVLKLRQQVLVCGRS